MFYDFISAFLVKHKNYIKKYYQSLKFHENDVIIIEILALFYKMSDKTTAPNKLEIK